MSESTPKHQTGHPVPPEQRTETPLKGMASFDIGYDNEERDTMVLSVPLKNIAEDNSINGLMFLLGFFEHAKNEAVATMKIKRARILQAQAAKSNLILPGQPKMSVH